MRCLMTRWAGVFGLTLGLCACEANEGNSVGAAGSTIDPANSADPATDGTGDGTPSGGLPPPATDDDGAGPPPAGEQPGGEPAEMEPPEVTTGDAPGNERCVDGDADGYGVQCIAGGDCDDGNASVAAPDICNGQDDDCDGNTDEFLVDVCEACNLNCTSDPTPGPTDSWDPPTADNSEDVVIDDGGAITLARDEMESFAVWVANTDEDTVSKLDSRTNREVARYVSVVASAPYGSPSFVPPNGRNKPSRTAVDQNFDAYVANRALESGLQGTVTKYANNEIDCIDKNLNGLIDTSRDLNNDGIIDRNDPTEFFGEADECILWTVPVGAAGGIPRALAVGLAGPDKLVGDVFVGLFGARQVCRLSAVDGSTQACVDTPSFQPYGAAADGRGAVWFVSRTETLGLGFIDSLDNWTTIAPTPGCGGDTAEPYGVAVDADNRVYFATSNCDTNGLYRYDHYGANGPVWQQTSYSRAATGRGVAVGTDSVWVAISGNGNNQWGGGADRIEQFAINGLLHQANHALPTGRSQVGVGVSFDGSIWAVSQQTNSASRLDPGLPVGDPNRWIEHPVGATPYTYSDFIGFGLNVFVDPRGFYRFVLEGCGAGEATLWRGVRHISDLPAGTQVVVNVRTADTRQELQNAQWVGPFGGNPADLRQPPGPAMPGQFAEFELVLSTADQELAPRVFGVEVAQECDIIIE